MAKNLGREEFEDVGEELRRDFAKKPRLNPL
jgi:hypothetical protein